jgi:hypothetical protein
MVRVLQAGVCETDLQLIQGLHGLPRRARPRVRGRRGIGPLAGAARGGRDQLRVPTCDTCRAGLQTHCPNRTVLGILNHDGAFADRIAVPQVNCTRCRTRSPRRGRVHRTGGRRLPDPGAALDRAPRPHRGARATAVSATCARRSWRGGRTTCSSWASTPRSWRSCRRAASRPRSSPTPSASVADIVVNALAPRPGCQPRSHWCGRAAPSCSRPPWPARRHCLGPLS